MTMAQEYKFRVSNFHVPLRYHFSEVFIVTKGTKSPIKHFKQFGGYIRCTGYHKVESPLLQALDVF